MKKCAMKMKQIKGKKRRACKNVLMEESTSYIECIQKTGENNFDKLCVNDSGHNEGTICLVNG